tara:strand:- start:1234 stop:2118 length:885 start_codon:yes stop_codon:yes gene_type:complete
MSLSKLTTIIIVTINGKVSFTMINKLQKSYKIIIVENNNDRDFKKKILSKFKNISVLLPKKNLGFAGGNNMALKKVKTPFVLLLNPDVKISIKNIMNLELYSRKFNNFSILAPNSNHFIETINTNLDKGITFQTYKKDKGKITEIPWVPGWCMYCRMSDIKKVNFFDERYFLYFEEADLCKRLKKKNKKFFLINENKIFHQFQGLSKNLSNDDSINHLRLRLWHYHWSSFYYHKKHYGYLKSFLLHISKFLRFSLLKYSYMLVGNTRSYKVSKAKADGLFHQILNKDSSFRIDL